jgi:release factor glutamine methyltransferase
MPEVSLTLGSLIDEATQRLGQSGVTEPRREAIRIWSELTGSDSVSAVLSREAGVEMGAVERFHHAVSRRSTGEPLAHVTGWVGFRHLELRSDKRALIPRPETEGLVDLVLERVRTGRVADVGTGSGCLALSLATEGSFAQVLATDCSRLALEVARLNRELVGAAVSFIQGDLCAPIGAGTLDALVSNPPYLTVAEYAGLEGSVRDWEPALALLSGEDGMEATVRLLEAGRSALRPGGWLALEVDNARAELAGRVAATLGWRAISVHMDLFGRERFLLAQRSEHGDLG